MIVCVKIRNYFFFYKNRVPTQDDRIVLYLQNLKDKMKQLYILFALCIMTGASAACNTRSRSGAHEDNTLYRMIDSIAAKYDATVGVAVIINGKDTVTYNGNIRYPMMSVFKFHQALAVLGFLQKNGIPADTMLHISKAELRPDTYSPLRDRYPEGNIDLPIATLLEYTLQLSDNNACDILFDRIVGIPETDSHIRSLGVTDFSIAVNEEEMHADPESCRLNWSTPLATAGLTELFITGKALSGEYFRYMKETMFRCNTGTGRLPHPLKGTGAAIGHKTGTSDQAPNGRYYGINDIGFVLLDSGDRYSIAVFVTDSGETLETTEHLIAEISAAVLQHITGNKTN